MFRTRLKVPCLFSLSISGLISGVALAGDSPLSFPAVSCKDAWKNSKQTDYFYDFHKDPTPESPNIASFNNSGYKNYLARMSELGLNRQDCHKTWTVLIYMTAGQDLLPYAYVDMEEMESKPPGMNVDATSSSSIRSDVLVQLNSEEDKQMRRIHLFTHPEKTYPALKKADVPTLKANLIQSPIVSLLEKLPNETEFARLENFIKWGMETYPSEHYLLIIWGHGKLGGLALEPSGKYLDMASLRKVLMEVNNWSGDKLDVLAADSCFWMAVDDVERLSTYTRSICGSSDVESYAGFPYGTILSGINSGKFGGAPTQLGGEEAGEPDRVAWMISQLYQESFDSSSGDPSSGLQYQLDPDAVCCLTGCSVSSKHVSISLLPAMNHLGNALLAALKKYPTSWMGFKSVIDSGEFYQNSTQDLGAFLQSLSALPFSAEFQKTILNTYHALNYAVINSVLGRDYPKFDPATQMGPRGLAVWLPKTSEEYHQRVSEFSTSILYDKSNGEAPGWGAWMDRMYPVIPVIGH